MANNQEIAQINEINKGLDNLNKTIDNTASGYLKLVKTIEEGNKSIKDSAANLNLVAKVQKETTDNTKKLDELSRQLASSEAKLKQIQDSRLQTVIENRLATQQATQAIKDKVKAEQAEEGSLVRMRLKLKELTAEYDRAGVRTKAATKEINDLSKSIQKAEEATNRHQRNVGNYKEAFSKFKGVIAELPGPLNTAMGAAEGLVTKLGAFGPVGLWVGGAIMSIGAPLAAFFLKSEKGVEMLERKFAGFRASISVLVGELINSGEKMAESFDKPAKSTWWTAILSTFGPSMGVLGARMDSAAIAAEAYTKKQQEMEDAERGLIVPRAQANLQIKEAMLLYNDESKSLAVRINALKEAIRIENLTADTEIAAQKERVANIKEVNELKKQSGQLRDADDLKLQNAIAREIELQTESAGRQIRATARIRTATEELNKKAAEDAKVLADKKIKEEERFAYSKTGLEKMTLKETLAIQDDELKSNQDFLDAKLKQAQKEADDEAKIEEDKKQAKIDLAIEAGNAIFEFRNMALQKELNSLQVEKDAKLSNAKLTTEQRAAIEADYEKKSNALKAKQAKNDKLQALFNIAVNTAVAISKASPIVPLMILAAAAGALQASLVAAQPIPKYAKGTQSAAERFIAGEAGRELMMLRSGELAMAEKATYFEGSKFKGAKIFSNPETERIIGASDRGLSGQSISDSRIIAGLEKLNTTIKNKPVIIQNSEYKQIGLQMSNHQEVYLNRLTK